MRKYVITAVAVALVVLGALASRPGALEVEADTVARTALSVVIEEEGETRVRDRYEVSAPVSGRVQRILLEPGDPVVAEETLLARFLPVRPVPLDARSEAEARAAVRAARSTLGRAEAELQRALNQQSFAESEKKRYLELREDGIVSADQLERVELASETAAEAARAADFAVAASRGELQAAEARLLRGSGRAGASAIDLFSPVDGVVLKRIRESEAVVGPGEPLIVVGDPRSLEIVADFLSNDAVQMQPGQPASVFGWGGDPIEAVVQRIEPSGFTKISALGVEEQRVNVIFDFAPGQQEAARLGDNFRVELGVRVWESPDELTVGNGALFRRGAEWAAYVFEDGKAVERSVEVGRRGRQRSQVVSGLTAGDVVVLYPPSSLVEGARIAAISDAE